MNLYWDDTENLRSDVLNRAKKIVHEVHEEGIVENIEGKKRLLGGKACGLLIQISDENFQTIADESCEQYISIAEELYRVVSINHVHRTAVYKSSFGEELVFVYSNRSTIFDTSLSLGD